MTVAGSGLQRWSASEAANRLGTRPLMTLSWRLISTSIPPPSSSVAIVRRRGRRPPAQAARTRTPSAETCPGLPLLCGVVRSLGVPAECDGNIGETLRDGCLILLCHHRRKQEHCLKRAIDGEYAFSDTVVL